MRQSTERYTIWPITLIDGVDVYAICGGGKIVHTLNTLPVADAICARMNAETARTGHNMETDNGLV